VAPPPLRGLPQLGVGGGCCTSAPLTWSLVPPWRPSDAALRSHLRLQPSGYGTFSWCFLTRCQNPASSLTKKLDDLLRRGALAESSG
jgi:hypothetical protein